MDESSFRSLIKPDKYQVFVLTCPAALPFIFARHPWFIVNRRGAVSRWEVFWRSKIHPGNWGHLNKDFYPLTLGVPALVFSDRFPYSDVRLLGHIEGDEGSVADKMSAFIEDSPETYPYCNKYSLKGPNSNTYAQWVLDRFPESGLRLPWNCFGKGCAP